MRFWLPIVAAGGIGLAAGALGGLAIGLRLSAPEPWMQDALFAELSVWLDSPCEPGSRFGEPPHELPCVGLASRTLPPGTVVSDDAVRGVWLPPEYLAPTAVLDPRGRTTSGPLYAGDFFDERRLAPPGAP